MAAPKGNQFAANARQWRAAIERALEARTKSRVDGKKEIDAIAEQLVIAAASGDLAALREFGDRIEGKPSQAVTVAGDDDGGPIHMVHEVALVAIDATEGRATPQDS